MSDKQDYVNSKHSRIPWPMDSSFWRPLPDATADLGVCAILTLSGPGHRFVPKNETASHRTLTYFSESDHVGNCAGDHKSSGLRCYGARRFHAIPRGRDLLTPAQREQLLALPAEAHKVAQFYARPGRHETLIIGEDCEYDSHVKNRIRVTATEAARDFSRLLDRVSAGAEAVIERHTEPVAVLSPAELAPRKLSECIAIRLARASAAPDDRFAEDLVAIIQEASADEPPAWG